MEKYRENGVIIYPAIPSAPSVSKITYNGLLYQSGAMEVFAHVGYGSTWQNTCDYKMRKTDHGFEASISIPQHSECLNICFKDTASNWDNHAGVNYRFAVGSPNNNSTLEVAEEIGIWNNLCHSCKELVSRWFTSSN